MSEPPSVRWGQAIVDAMAHAGIELVIVAPGSRSTPLVMASVDHPEVSAISMLDERSAGFFAVGYGKAEQRPAAVITTSGTATANLFPAVQEANRSRTPMVVCTADRPRELQHSGANQTITQSGMYGEAVRWAPTLPDPTEDERANRSLQSTVGTALARSRGPVPGPVHLNVPLPKPLTPTSRRATPGSTRSRVAVSTGRSAPAPETIDRLASYIDESTRGVVVAGIADPMTSLAPLMELGGHLGLPVLADPLSGVRFSDPAAGNRPCGGYDGYLDAAWIDAPGPDLIVRAGRPPTSQRLQRYLASHEGEHVLIDAGVAYRDPQFSTTELVAASPDLVVDRLLDRLPADGPSTAWADGFDRAEERYWNRVASAEGELPAEGQVAARTLRLIPEEVPLFVSNSMPIRDVDRFGDPGVGPRQVFGNRGVSGIDGIVSSALGVGSTRGEVALLTGDLAFLHDMNGLQGIARADTTATIVVINNDGGGIFNALPIADHDPPFTDLFRTPHGIDLGAVADLYDLEYVQTTPDTFATTFEVASGADSRLIEVVVDGQENHATRESLTADLAADIDPPA